MDNQKNLNEKEVFKMKRFALVVLGIAFVLYLLGLFLNCGPLKAFGEAAMVGGIADWFAVVALFKHPLGIPIPHTAIIPNKKDKIGDNLGSFVSEEFLVKKNLELKVDQFNPGLKAAHWLAEQKNALMVGSLIVEHVLPSILKSIDDVEIQRFVQEQFQKRVRTINFSQWIAIGLEALSKSKKQQQLVTNVLKTLLVELQNNKDVIEEKVKKSTPFLTFGLADKKITTAIFNGLYEFLEQASYPESKVRERIDSYIQEFVMELQTMPELQKKVNDTVLDFVQKEEVQSYLIGIWDEVKKGITEDIAKGDASLIQTSIVSLLQQFGKNIASDFLMREKINLFVKHDVLEVLIKNKHAIGELIASTVKSWDAAEVSEKLELQVGKDLQFIRINGTLVGGIVGLFIYFIELLL
ncbi:DUF445 domain-containing protein [Flavobacterium sp. RSSA_27]|uniref:DUF445 domain-containing protein n=1 Tax=Flavobacterium sp. RSSA_27 TaxID=3447667 RepID=UPI003F3A7D3D